jgi:hypothetical protein
MRRPPSPAQTFTSSAQRFGWLEFRLRPADLAPRYAAAHDRAVSGDPSCQSASSDSSKEALFTSGRNSIAVAVDASTQRSAGKPRVGRKARGRTTGLTPAAQRLERIDAGRVAVAPRHSQPVAADETSISDRKPRRLTTSEPCLIATVAGPTTCRARACPAQLFEVEPAHLAIIEGHLNVGVTVDGDGGDVDRGLLSHSQSLVLATIRETAVRRFGRDRMVDGYVTVYEQTVMARDGRGLNAGR